MFGCPADGAIVRLMAGLAIIMPVAAGNNHWETAAIRAWRLSAESRTIPFLAQLRRSADLLQWPVFLGVSLGKP
jgi:hypothetical protein